MQSVARDEQLEYIRQMLFELRAMAAGVNAPTLAYLLEMSVLEASQAQKLAEMGTERQGK